MTKKVILALLILILICVFTIFLIYNNTVNIYTDGENISVETHTLSNINIPSLNDKLCNLTLDVMNNATSNVTTLKSEAKNICNEYGLSDVTINIDSSIGENQLPVMVHVDGTSMLPTLKDGQTVLLNKTHIIKVGDIVVAESEEYGGIIKRVGDIQGDNVYLISDNKNISYEYINGILYKVKGISTWVDLSDINGVVIDY